MAVVDQPKVRIVSDGTVFGTKVTVDDVDLKCVSKIEWSLDVREGLAVAVVTLHQVEVDAVGYEPGSMAVEA